MKRFELLSIIGSVVAVGITLVAVVVGSIAGLRTEVRTDIAEVRTEMQTLRAEVNTEMQILRTEMQALRTEVRADIRGPGAPARGGGAASGAHRRSARRAAQRDHCAQGRGPAGAEGIDLSRGAQMYNAPQSCKLARPGALSTTLCAAVQSGSVTRAS